MREKKAFFSFATAAAVLLAGAVATAGVGPVGSTAVNVPTPAPPPPPMSCSTDLFDVSVSSGPTFVPCSAAGGQCTEIGYDVVTTAPKGKKKPSHVFILEGVGVWDVSPNGSLWYSPCEGIPGLREPGFGRDVCHEQAIKISTRQGVTSFKITLAGLRHGSPTTVAIPMGDDGPPRGDDKVAACTILGIGLEGGPDPNQLTQRTETIDFKGCVVQFTRDPATGEVEKAQLLTETSPSGQPCQSPSLQDDHTIAPRPVGEIEVLVGRFNLGGGKFGDGYVSTGTESCTTRVIGGRVYTWGSPCP